MLVLLGSLLTPVCTALKQNFLDQTSKSPLNSEYNKVFGSGISPTCSNFNFLLHFALIDQT